MSLNIKNDEAHRLARELAELTGESMTTAVTISIRERRDRMRASREIGLADRLLTIGADTAKRLPPEIREVDHAELLYDDRGLPR